MDKGEGGGVADAAGGGSALEVELTLGGDPAALDQGWRAAVPAGGSARKQRLRSTYFDTGDFRLRRRGFTLRIREDGERLVQTLKSDGPCGAGAVLRRSEWSRPVEAPVPSLPVAPDRAVRDAVGPLRPAELAPAFSTDVMRRTATVEVSAADRGTALVEVALDSGEIRAQGRRDRVSELELELIEGPASALYELAMTLQASAPLCIQTASKAKRGYVLAGGEGYAGCKAPHACAGAGDLRGPGPRRDLSRLRRSLRREPRCGAGPQRSRRGPPVSRRPAPAALGHRGLQGRSAAGRRRLAGTRGEPPHRRARPGARLGRVHHRNAGGRAGRPARRRQSEAPRPGGRGRARARL